jgi:hypothetical protein
MTTIKISVKSNKDAALLVKLLKSLNFVINVEPVLETRADMNNQYELLKNILDKKASKKLFKEIKDPLQWQKDLRDEWS